MEKRADTTTEILELLEEITIRIEQVEELMDETCNTRRCELWGNQMAMVYSAQVVHELAEKDWKEKELEDKAKILRKDSAINKQLPMNPKLGF